MLKAGGTAQETQGEKLLLTVEEARSPQYLDCGRSTIYELLAAGTLPHIRLKRSIRIPRHALLDWINSQTIQTV